MKEAPARGVLLVRTVVGYPWTAGEKRIIYRPVAVGSEDYSLDYFRGILLVYDGKCHLMFGGHEFPDVRMKTRSVSTQPATDDDILGFIQLASNGGIEEIRERLEKIEKPRLQLCEFERLARIIDVDQARRASLVYA